MQTTNLLNRVEILEQRVSALETLPARVDALAAQVAQLRIEMRDEFSAVRAEVRAGDEETRHLLVATEDRLRAEIQGGDEETRILLSALIQETRTHMLVLHEDLVERIKLLGEARPSPSTDATKTAGAARRRKRPPPEPS